MLGSMAGSMCQPTVGFSEQFVDWRLLARLCDRCRRLRYCLRLYSVGADPGWIGRWLGGGASTLQLRAVPAWSTVPTILGFLIGARRQFCASKPPAAPMRGGRPSAGGDVFSSFGRSSSSLLMLGVRPAFRLLADDRGLCPERDGLRWRGFWRCLFGASCISRSTCRPRRWSPTVLRGRLCLCLQIRLWLQPLFAAVLAAIVPGAHPSLRAKARRRCRVPLAQGRADRLRQARGGIARRGASR